MKCWKGSLWCQEFQDFYGIHFHDMVAIFFIEAGSGATYGEDEEWSTGFSALPDLPYHACAWKGECEDQRSFLGEKTDGFWWSQLALDISITWLSHAYHMAITTWMLPEWGFYYRMLKLMMKNAEIWTEFDMAWLLDSTWLSMTQWSKVYIIRSSQSQMCFDVFLCGSRLKWRL